MRNYRWWVGIALTLVSSLIGAIYGLENRYTTKAELQAFDQLEQARLEVISDRIADKVIDKLYKIKKIVQ